MVSFIQAGCQSSLTWKVSVCALGRHLINEPTPPRNKEVIHLDDYSLSKCICAHLEHELAQAHPINTLCHIHVHTCDIVSLISFHCGFKGWICKRKQFRRQFLQNVQY